jgi:enamine deaminase RidA (YjgF/YER057c/UK114 family)
MKSERFAQIVRALAQLVEQPSVLNGNAALPASTLLQISRLANPAYLVEVEVIAILPPKA